jgi:hypothetical protein
LNWEAIGAVSEGLGATGVIASLLYVGMQVRANTRAAAVEAKLQSTRMYTDFLVLLVQSPELNDLMLRGRKDWKSLDQESLVRYSNLALVAFSFFSAAYFQFSKGTLSDDDWTESKVMIQYWLQGKGCRQWWGKVGKHSFGRPFIAFVDLEIAQMKDDCR